MRFSSSSSKPAGPVARFFFSRIFPWPFALVGAVTLYFGLQSIQRAKQSTDWPTVAGVVVSSEVESNRSDDGTTYSAEVLYDYDLNGIKHTSNQVSYGDFGSSNPSRARKIVNRYPVGAEVTVHYMPDKPEESVLEPGINGGAFLLPAFGAVFLLVGLAMLWFLPSLMRQEVPSDGTDGADFT